MKPGDLVKKRYTHDAEVEFGILLRAPFASPNWYENGKPGALVCEVFWSKCKEVKITRSKWVEKIK